jgi:hypothetical protein
MDEIGNQAETFPPKGKLVTAIGAGRPQLNRSVGRQLMALDAIQTIKERKKSGE